MTPRTIMPAGWMTMLCVLLLGAAAAPGAKEKAGRATEKDANRLTGILKSVDVKRGTLTIERVGVDVDDALSQRLKDRGKDTGAAPTPDPAKPADGKSADDAKPADGAEPADAAGPADGAKPSGAAKATVLAIGGKAKLYIKFRSSPSIANHAERRLDDLRPMVGWPVTIQLRGKGEPVVAAEVIAWRGTPWKVSR